MLGAVGMDMSSGDIWSTGAFSFESPLKDLLDSKQYTLEQLLNEDELLQELRGCHMELITYFSSEVSVTRLVQYMIQQQQQQPNQSSTQSETVETTDKSHNHENVSSVSEDGVQMNGIPNQSDIDKKSGKWLLRYLQEMQSTLPCIDTDTSQTPPTVLVNGPSQHERQMIRFPYMACEIICCEIPSIIHTLVDGKCIFHHHPTTTTTTPTTTTTTSNSNEVNTNTNIMTNEGSGLPQLRGQSLIDEQLLADNDDDEISSPSLLPITITDVTEIVTSESQGDDIVEVVAKPEVTLVVENSVPPETQHQPSLSILDLLFSLLYSTPIGQLDDYRAGYFDKILSVLFRKRPDELTKYINSGGIFGRTTLIRCMLNHLYSHSVMQIAQRLLLPPRPIGQPQMQAPQQEEDDEEESPPLPNDVGDTENEATSHQQLLHQNTNSIEDGAEIIAGDDGDDPESVGVRCDWGNSPEVLEMLLDTLIGPHPHSMATNAIEQEEEDESQLLDLSLNASEVLITIIQNSMLSSTTMLTLTSYDVIARIVDAATTLRNPNNYFSPHESVLTSAMNVLESLVLQLGGYGAVGTMTFLPEDELINQQLQQQHNDDDTRRGKDEMNDAIFQEDPSTPQLHTVTDQIQEVESDDTLNTGQEVGLVDKHLISDLGAMLDNLPLLLERLSILLRHPSTSSWTSPTQFSKLKPMQLLGNSRLRIVRVLESLVLLGDPDVDSILVQSNCLEICLDFFWEFQWCSMLHQSVANLLVHVFEGQNTRFEMQKYFLVQCNLLGRLMESFTEDKSSHETGNSNASPPPPTLPLDMIDDIQAAREQMMTQSLSNEDDEKSPDTPLHISEDDVDAAMDAQVDVKVDDVVIHASDESTTTMTPAMVVLSTDDTKTETKETSVVGETHLSPPAQALRCGYMGHVIIICQALVHAYSNNPDDQEVMQEDGEGLVNDQMENLNVDSYGGMEVHASTVPQQIKADEDGAVNPTGVGSERETEEGEPIGPKDIYGDPLLLFELVHTHQLAELWHTFVDTTLAMETAIQSTPLGGLIMQATGSDMMHAHRPGLADEGYMMGDDGEGPPVPPRGMLGGGDMIHMDENDLDIAASLMHAGLSLGRPNAPDIDEDHSNNSADSEKSYNSGETARDKVGYAFDDPLGKAGGLGIELDKLTKLSARGLISGTNSGDDDDGSHSSDEGEIETPRSGSGDVPVIDLFAGNFNYDQTSSDKESTMAPPVEEFANFAAFDTPGTDAVGVFVGVVDEALTGSKGMEHKDTASSDLDDLFGKGDHAELLELDELPIENTLSPIKPITPSGVYSDASTSQNATKVFNGNGSADDDVKADLFDAKLDNSDAGQAAELDNDDIQTAPSDELMADSSIEPVSDDTLKGDIGQL